MQVDEVTEGGWKIDEKISQEHHGYEGAAAGNGRAMELSGAGHGGELKLVGAEMAGMAHMATPRGAPRIPLRECSNEQGDGVGKESA